MAGWDTGLFECFSDVKVLLLSWCCGVCQMAAQKATVEEHDCGVGDLIPVWCCGVCCFVSIRGKIREKYSIDGSCFVDLLTGLFCGVCAISQHTRQLRAKGAKPGGICMEK